MAEAIVLVIRESILTKLANLATEEIFLARFTRIELNMLRDLFTTIKSTLEAIEEDQYAITVFHGDWLEMLKDVTYHADDMLDDFVMEVLPQPTEDQETICCITKEVRDFLSRLPYNFTVGLHIMRIRVRLEKIISYRNNLHPKAEGSLHSSVVNVETNSFLPNPSDVIGRDGDKYAIMTLLMDFESENARNVQVIPIVGIGGVGKTTLVKLLFNDERVVRHFDLRIWVYVSDDFDAKRIASKILERVTKTKRDGLEMEEVQSSLRVRLEMRRYLLVLDALWNEDYDKWVQLKDLLMGGERGSKILVTTRSNKVASIVSTTSQHLLLGPLLNIEDCWSVFKQRAFREGEEEEKFINLIPIGKEIVNKCRGVPLAITEMGNLLRCNTDESYWRSVRDNEMWFLTTELKRQEGKSVNILPILKFSYDHLPPHLKACFVYCSLFPKDCVIYREMLIQLWMAQGLIQSSNQQMEDVGNLYFNALFSRSFFIDATRDVDGNVISCKLHHLMHDLARYIAGTEYLIVDTNTVAPRDETVRHVSLVGQPNRGLSTAQKLRTILNPYCIEPSYDTCLSFLCLRVLDLRCLKLEYLPYSIGELKHLRYLDLSSSDIKAFPYSFSKLRNLQTLKVADCRSLRELPKDMRKMVSLRHLDDRNTSLTRMPSGIGQLCSLQTLPLFVVGTEDGTRISELHDLNGLRGELRIIPLENVRDATEAVAANLREKQDLKTLMLVWRFRETGTLHREKHDEDVLEGLHPPSNLKELYVSFYGGVEFPSWRMSTLVMLVKIELKYCLSCRYLPALGELPSLKILHLMRMSSLQCIGTEVFGQDVGRGFPSLEELYLFDLPNLDKWECSMSADYDGATTSEGDRLLYFPRLAILKVSSCPRLVEMPFHPSLQVWELEGCRGELLLRSMVPNLNAGSLHFLKSLKIACEDLEYLPAEGLQNLVSLEELCIGECLSLISLAEDALKHLTSLRSLYIENCPGLTSIPISQYITHLSISNCPNATWLEDEEHESLTGFNCLQSLYIDRQPYMMSLPNKLQHATRRKGDNDGMRNLTTLSSCRMLQFLTTARERIILMVAGLTTGEYVSEKSTPST